jgi:hypothetical protein
MTADFLQRGEWHFKAIFIGLNEKASTLSPKLMPLLFSTTRGENLKNF